MMCINSEYKLTMSIACCSQMSWSNTLFALVSDWSCWSSLTTFASFVSRCFDGRRGFFSANWDPGGGRSSLFGTTSGRTPLVCVSCTLLVTDESRVCDFKDRSAYVPSSTCSSVQWLVSFAICSSRKVSCLVRRFSSSRASPNLSWSEKVDVSPPSTDKWISETWYSP